MQHVWIVSPTTQIVVSLGSTLSQMGVRKRENLTVVALPRGRHALSAPPILVASTHTVDYCCGNCGAVLLHADVGQVHGLLIHCTSCGSYNSTEGFVSG
jgi:predicted RNA-binding Zn-ribbon protein involved in translation (DUF1610 family)